MFHEVIIIGGGAAGITTAIYSKDRGSDIAILEGNDRIGKKILITGNGRCNISNIHISYERYHSDNTNFFRNILNRFTVNNTSEFFYSLGLPLITLNEGKMFPMSLQASSVVDIFRLALEDRNIPIYFNSKVKEVTHNKKGFKILTVNNKIFECKKLVIACGGKSASNTGSDGSGYALSKSLGHNIISPIPAIVQLKLNYKNLKALSGIKFDGFAEIIIDNKTERREFGEILFTDYGVSGPPILQISRNASYAISKGKKVIIQIDILPNLSKTEVKDILETHWAIFSHRSILNSFIGLINKKIIPILLKEAGINNIHKPCSDLEWKEKNNIIEILKGWRFEVTDTNSFSNAQVTAGGVDTKEVHIETLESKIIPNFYFCGEVLDVDGDCGGFNLQWAWSSAMAVGEALTKN